MFCRLSGSSCISEVLSLHYVYQIAIISIMIRFNKHLNLQGGVNHSFVKNTTQIVSHVLIRNLSHSQVISDDVIKHCRLSA